MQRIALTKQRLREESSSSAVAVLAMSDSVNSASPLFHPITAYADAPMQ
jgi:hypothetical protein